MAAYTSFLIFEVMYDSLKSEATDLISLPWDPSSIRVLTSNQTN